MELLSSDRCRSHSGHHSHQLDQASAGSYRGHGQQHPAVPSAAKRLGRTPSSPSVFFSKVKERIREKVYETSTEWPHMAAIVQERRQRAADAFEARMSIRRQKTVHAGPVIDPDGGEDHRVGGRRGRVKSDQQPSQHHKASPCSSCGSGCSGSSSFDRERAKSAFRRRSISEDTYNRQPPGSTAQRPGDRGGVVCSNDELRAMAFEHKLRRSPVAVKHPETGSSSLECCRESIVSCDSLSNNSASSNPKLPMFRDGSLFPSTNSRDAPLPPVFPHSVSSTIQQHRDPGGNASAGTACRVSLTVTAAEDDDDRGTEDARRQLDDVACDGEMHRRDSVVIREIVFDEHGQTWDIYGAEFDPEILGQAIQSHLEKIMRKNLAVDEARIIDAPDSTLRLRGDSANDCRPMCSNGERETTQRALGFFLRYLCSVARRK